MATRYRCSACGNLTRFDVVTSRRTRAYHHFTVGGELRIEDETVLDERVDEVSCRWCGSGASVEEIDAGAPGVGSPAAATVGSPATGSAAGSPAGSAADGPGAS